MFGELQGSGYSTDGKVSGNSDGYTIPNDNDSNTIFDFQEESTPSITNQPADVVICLGCFAFITVNSNADTYQWQLFNGTTWDNLSDSGIYNGSGTNTLNITNVSASENNNRYRVIISNQNYVCDSLISDEAVLSIRVKTVITNRRITYRVKKN